MEQRLDWIDYAKAIAIYLVVVGHFGALDLTVKALIYSFHLPVFLFLTGWLLFTSDESKLLSKVFSNIGIYSRIFIFFTIISITLWYLREVPKPPELVQVVKQNIYGTHGVEKAFTHANGAIWYFPFLVSSLILFVILSLSKKWLGLLVCFMLTYFIKELPVRLPWSLDLAPIGAFFILMGFFVRQESDAKKFSTMFRFRIHIATVSLLLWIALTIYNGQTNINRVMFGDSIFLFYASALLGITATCLFCYSFNYSKLIKVISENTLMILSLHLFLVKLARTTTFNIEEPYRTVFIFILSAVITVLLAFFGKSTMPYFKRYIMRK